MSILSSPSSLSQHFHPETRLRGHELDCALMEMEFTVRQCADAEADADEAQMRLFADDDGSDPKPPTSGALLAEIRRLPDFALIAAVDAADRRDALLRVDDYEGFLNAASAELVRRLGVTAAVRNHGYGSRQHVELHAASLATPELIAAMKAPARSHFSDYVAAVYPVELDRRQRQGDCPNCGAFSSIDSGTCLDCGWHVKRHAA